MRPTGVRRSLVTVALVVLVLAGGCHDGDRTGSDRGPRVWRQEPAATNGGFAAEVRGTLAYDEAQDCWLLEQDGLRYPVVWPAGTAGTSDGPGVVLDDGTTARVGDQVAGGGGFIQVADEYDIPAPCVPDTGEVAVFNANDPLTVLRNSG